MTITLRESGLLVRPEDVPDGIAGIKRTYEDAIPIRLRLQPRNAADRYDWEASFADRALTHTALVRNDPAIDFGAYRVILLDARGHRRQAVFDVLSMQESECGRYLVLALHERRAGEKAEIKPTGFPRKRIEKYGY